MHTYQRCIIYVQVRRIIQRATMETNAFPLSADIKVVNACMWKLRQRNYFSKLYYESNIWEYNIERSNLLIIVSNNKRNGLSALFL